MNGFYRVAAAVPKLRVGDPAYNVVQMGTCYREAAERGAAAVVFPELGITGYSCADMFEQRALIEAAEAGLKTFVAATADNASLAIVGTPLRVDARLFNAAAVIAKGAVLGFALKEYLPNVREFDEKRRFSSVRDFVGDSVVYGGREVPAGAGLVFCSENGVRFGVEIGADLWAVVPPSSNLAIGGAQIIFNLSSGHEHVGKADFRRNLVENQSARISGVYVLAGAGVHESTTDGVCSGHALIAENGRLKVENTRFARQASLIFTDINPWWVDSRRSAGTSFNDSPAIGPVRRLKTPAWPTSPDSQHTSLSAYPFVPSDEAVCTARCEEIFNIQVAGLAKRIEHTGLKRLVVGVSGGLDSTLALLVCAKMCDLLQLPRSFVLGVTLPGFGTSTRTKGNSVKLIHALGAELRVIRIAPAVNRHFKDIGHDPEIQNVVYENAQARERTQILMDLANAESGLLVGTGDMSEMALGWCTFNGDHMSMYNVNASVPKTLIRHLLSTVAMDAEPPLARVLLDINRTPVSPELLPGEHRTEDVLGPYALHDFFLYYLIKYGETPETLLVLALEAFGQTVSEAEVRQTLAVFLSRFVTQQFKRNAAPDGPKVGSVGLSPRGDWRCPSDLSSAVWQAPL